MAPTRSTLAAIAAGGLLSLGIGGTLVLSGTNALADSPSPKPSASPSAGAPQQAPGAPGKGFGRHGGFGFGHRGPGFGPLGGLLHGEMVVTKADGSGSETLFVQQGTVTGKTADTVTVRSSDGFTLTWTVDASTRIRAGKPPADRQGQQGQPGQPKQPGTAPANGTLADLAVGATVDAVGLKTGDRTATARSLGTRPAGAAGAATGGGRQGGMPKHTPGGGPGGPSTNGSTTATRTGVTALNA